MPARAAIDQFARAAADIDADPGKIRVWLPIIRQCGPAFLQECQNAIALSEALVTNWLSSYMFNNEPDAGARVGKIATWLADHNNFMAHSRPVWLEQLLEVEPMMKIRRLQELGKDFEAAVMAVYWAIDVTFSETGAFKLIEHQEGSAYIRLVRTAIVGPSAPSPNREERRRQMKPKGNRR